MIKILLYFTFLLCIDFVKCYANNDIAIKKVEISKNLIQQPKAQMINNKALIVVINKLSGINKTFEIISNSKFQIPDNNIEIELIDCKENFSVNIKEYLAIVKINNIKEVLGLNEAMNFEGEISSEFLYKNPIQNSLIAINLLQCQNDNQKNNAKE